MSPPKMPLTMTQPSSDTHSAAIFPFVRGVFQRTALASTTKDGADKQHRRHRQRAHGLALEVHHAQQQDAFKPRPQEDGQVLQPVRNTCLWGRTPPVAPRPEVPDDTRLPSVIPVGAPVGKPDKAPAHGAEDHIDIRDRLVHGPFLYFWPRSSMIWSRSRAAYSNSSILLASFISFSRRAMVSSRSRSVSFFRGLGLSSSALWLISTISRTLLRMVRGTMPWAC